MAEFSPDEIANREHIAPDKTGDNIAAKKSANYVWNGSAWVRMTQSGGGSGGTEYTDGDVAATHPIGGTVTYNKAGVMTAVSDTNPLPTTATITGGGDASAANQTTEITKLTSIDGKITAVNTGAVVVSSSALPTGAATSAKQPALGTAGTPSADVITVQGKTSMTPLLTDGSATTQPVSAASLPLPSGAATGAKQDTGNTSLSSIDAKLPAQGQALAAASVPVVLPAAQITTLTPPAAITGFATSTKQDTGNTSVASIDTKTPALGQALSAASVPVVLPAAQVITLTPPAAITGFSTSTKQSDGSQKTQVVDGAGNVIGATSNALDVNIKSGATAGTQYAEGATAATGTGTLAMGKNGTTLKAAQTDSAGNLRVDLSQTSANATAIKVDNSAVTQPVSAASLPLPTLAATSTKQSDGTQKTQVVDGSGNVIGATSNALDVNIKSGGSASASTTGTLTASAQTVALTLTGQTTAALQVTGTFVATMIAERTVDGTNWVSAYGYAQANETTRQLNSLSFSNVNQIWTYDVAGCVGFRLRCSAYTSGTATVNLRAVANSNQIVESFAYLIGQSANIGVDANQAGTWNISNVSGTVSLPTGASTGAKQDTGNTSLGNIDTSTAAVNTVLGSRADAKNAATDTTAVSAMSVLKQISASVQAPPSQAVTNAGTFATQSTLSAGSAIVGKVGIDQTTDGTTNKVYVGNIPHVIVDTAPSTTVTGTVTANAGTNLNTSALALDATLTGGTQKAIARGGAKGTTTAADVTSTASGANHQPLDVAIYDASGNQVTTFGGGTQYADATAAATPTGTQANWNEAGTQRATSLAKPLPIQAGTGVTIPVSLATNTPTLQSGSTTAVTQATAANLNATVVGTGTFAVQAAATLAAETTKVIGVTRTADGSGNLLTSTGSALDVNLKTSAATNISTNLAQVNGVTTLAGNGASGTGAQRVTLASDSTGQVAPAANATATGTSVSYTAALVATKVAVNASAGNLYGYHIYNPNSVVIYIQLWNVASASVTVGTTAPTAVIAVPAGGWADSSYPVPITFGTALTVAATTTASGSTAPTTGLTANFWYK